ncbi:MAG: hypothetical protein WA231_14810 [Methylocella sp.]
MAGQKSVSSAIEEVIGKDARPFLPLIGTLLVRLFGNVMSGEFVIWFTASNANWGDGIGSC